MTNFDATQTQTFTETAVIEQLDAYQGVLDASNAETQELPGWTLVSSVDGEPVGSRVWELDSEGYASGEKPHVSGWETAPLAVKPRLTETELDILYGFATGAIAGLASAIVFYVLTLA